MIHKFAKMLCLKQSTVLKLVPQHSYNHTNNFGSLWAAETLWFHLSISINDSYPFIAYSHSCQCFEAAEDRDTSQLWFVQVQDLFTNLT